MPCCEEKIIKRKKNYTHVLIIACQFANKMNQKVAVVKKTSGVYGDYYDFIDYDYAKRHEYKVLRIFERGDTI